MHSGFKYPIDEQVLRSKLLENSTGNKEQAWEKFEHYLSQQKPIFTESKKARFSLMIPPQLLLRGFLACLIILPTLLFYRQFNTQIPAALHKAHSASTVSKPSHKPLKTLSPTQAPLLSATPTLPEPLEPGSRLETSSDQSIKRPAQHLKSIATASTKDSTKQQVPAVSALPAASANGLSAPAEKPLAPQPEQTGELNEQL